VVVVEGYMDVIALANAGIADAVAPLGTALTEMQLELLWRMVEVPVLCFDGDAAGQRAAMRAIARALPMLAPMRSLGIVRLPAGLDPDDLIKAQGAKAMEQILSRPAPLIDTLWEFERDAQPLATPEAKAGLKARLMAHVETIADPEIKSLYRRELSDRFSAFAYPPRPPRAPWQPSAQARPAPGQRGPWRGAAMPPPGLSDAAREQLSGMMAGGQRLGLMQAVLSGLARYPGQIARHTEALISLSRLLPEGAPAIESLLELAETLDSRQPTAICSSTQGQPAPSADIRYAFLDEGNDPDAACEELAEAVSLLVERPALEAALAATIARFDNDPEGSFAEQTRLRAQLMATEERLKAFGRRKASAGSSTDDTA
jgi:DNA primase